MSLNNAIIGLYAYKLYHEVIKMILLKLFLSFVKIYKHKIFICVINNIY